MTDDSDPPEDADQLQSDIEALFEDEEFADAMAELARVLYDHEGEFREIADEHDAAPPERGNEE